MQAARAFFGKVDFELWNNRSMSQILTDVGALPPRTAVFFTRMFRDGAGRAVISSAAAQSIAKATSVPMYALTDAAFGTGVVGGSVIDIAALGQRAGELAYRVLSGAEPKSIPLEFLTKGTPIFDSRALKRWGISESRLPPGSVVRFRPNTFWDQYKWLIMAILAVCLIQAALIQWLLQERRRRRLAQKTVEERLRLEQLVSELSGAFINLPADQMEAHVRAALGRVARLLNFDIASLSLFTGPGPKGRVAQLWTADGVPEIPDDLSERDFPWVAQELFSGRDVSVSSLDELPAAAAVDRATYERYGVRSTHNVPITAAGQVIGVLGLCAVFQQRDLLPGMLESQRLLGEVFASALTRQRADTALRESESRFRKMADSAPVMIWMSGTDKLCEYFNKQWLDFTGRSLDQELGNGWAEGIHADDRDRCLEIYGKSFEARQEFTMEYRLRRSDGQYGVLSDHGVPRFEEDGAFLGYIGSCIDVTERIRTEFELQRNREELAHVARVSTMSELTASVAHELNQPLGAILSNAEAAELFLKAEPPALDEVRDILEDIRKDDERAGDIIHHMRSLLRKHEVVLKPIDINAVVKDVFGLLEIEAAARKVSTSCEFAEGLPSVAADRVHVQQVIMNLVVNALDAMAETPEHRRKLVVRTATNNGGVEVSVADSGPGVPDDKLARLFDPFFTTKLDGMGMGLSIARTIVERHKGRIWAENNRHGGAMFSFTLPLSRDA